MNESPASSRRTKTSDENVGRTRGVTRFRLDFDALGLDRGGPLGPAARNDGHMHPDVLEEIEREIERLRRRYAALMRERPDAREVISRWAAEAAGLCWFVPLEDVVESDIDVEITTEVLIVRAERVWPEPAVLIGILPVPHGFDPEHVIIRFREETLEVRIRQVPRRDPR